jgi:hypothetical protein
MAFINIRHAIEVFFSRYGLSAFSYLQTVIGFPPEEIILRSNIAQIVTVYINMALYKTSQ